MEKEINFSVKETVGMLDEVASELDIFICVNHKEITNFEQIASYLEPQVIRIITLTASLKQNIKELEELING